MHVVPTKHLDGPSNIVTFHCEVTVELFWKCSWAQAMIS